MAKPKEKVGPVSMAFQEKCSEEKDRLRNKLAKQLQLDLQRMLAEEIHTDLEFHLKGGHSFGHKLILKARARSLWDRLCEGTVDDSTIFHMPHLDKSVFDACILEVYTSDCADVASEDLQLAMEDRAMIGVDEAMEGASEATEGACGFMKGACQALETSPCSSNLQSVSSGTDPFPDPHDPFGTSVDGVRDTNKQFQGVRLI